ncbi:MAG: hypothetical protein N3J91_05990 [Verrucomicrobiae bacterium]|nr:hypothetical protein [Verrucomicrobiae bacterium]
MSRHEQSGQSRYGAGPGVLRWFDARERNALLALLAAAVLLILCSLAGGMPSASASAAEPPPIKAPAAPAP